MSAHNHFTYFESDYYLFMHGIFSAKAARKTEKKQSHAETASNALRRMVLL